MTLPVLQPFLEHLKFEKRYSRHTLTAYEGDLTAFQEYLEAHYGPVPPGEVSHLYIRSWLASLKDGGASARTINRKISSLKAFYKFLLRRGEVAASPMGRIQGPKTEARLPQFVAEGDMHTLLHHVEFGEDWQGRTDRLIIHLLYYAGLRQGELLGLTEGSWLPEAGQLKVLGKGSKERMLPVAPVLGVLLAEYIGARKERFGQERPVLLLTGEDGKPLQPRAVYRRVRALLSAVTTIEKRSPHVLRHTFATHLANGGADLNAVKELLGHSSLAATQVYTHNTIDKLRNIHRKAHPRH